MFTTALTIILSLLIANILIVPTASFSLFRLAPGNKEHLQTMPFTSTQIFKGFFSSIPSLIITYFLYPFALFQKYWLPKDENSRKASILFVHGYIHTSSAWVAFSKFFKEAGYTDQHAFSYRSFNIEYDDIVARLEQEVAKIRQERPEKKIILIGHSLGGLAIRGFLNTSEHRDCIQTAITIGTPHQGTTMAKMAFSKLGRQLQLYGPLYESITSKERKPPCPTMAIYSPTDNMVMPMQGLRINAPGWQEYQVSPVCHVGLLYHRETMLKALECIQESETREEGADTA